MASIQLESVDDPRITPPIKHEWQDDALCTEIGLDAFFPAKGGTNQDAKRICASCYVSLECLEYALTCEESDNNGNIRYGIFGGLTERERRRASTLREEQPSLTLEEVYETVISVRSPKKVKRFTQPTSQELQAL